MRNNPSSMLHHHYTSPHPTIQLSPRVGRCDNVLANLVNGPVVDTEYRVSTLEMGIVRVKHIYIYIYSPTIASHQRQELIVERMQSGKKLWRFSSFFLFFFFFLGHARGVPLCQFLFRERVRQLHGDGREKLDHRLIGWDILVF